MSLENPIDYLSQEDQTSVLSWVEAISPILKHPKVAQTDLVIEGGTGTGETLPHIMRVMFPEAVYVGTDLSPRLMGGNRVSGQISTELLQQVTEANAHPTVSMRWAKVLANCFDVDFVRSIQQKATRSTPLLVTFNSLNALLDRKMNPMERKREMDEITSHGMTDVHSPYVSQLHLGVVWKDNGQTSFSDRFYWLEEAAKQNGWATERLDIGLLLIRP